MARKKKHLPAKRHHHRSGGKKMGAIEASGLQDDAMTLVGLAIGQVAATMAQRQMTNLSPKVIGAVEVIGGIMIKNKATSPLVQSIGWGIAGAGTMGLAHDFGVIHGIDGICNDMFHSGEQRVMMPMPAQSSGPSPIPMVTSPMLTPTPGKLSVGGYDEVSGINNFDSMSGLSNFDMMSGAGEGENWMKDEFNSVKPLGL